MCACWLNDTQTLHLFLIVITAVLMPWLVPAPSWPVPTRGPEDAHRAGLVPRRGYNRKCLPSYTLPPPLSLSPPLLKVPVMAWECSAVCCDGLKCLFFFLSSLSFSIPCDMKWLSRLRCDSFPIMAWFDFVVVTGLCVWVGDGKGTRVCVCARVWSDYTLVHACFHNLSR